MLMDNIIVASQYLPHLKRMDLSNSKNLRMTPRFDGMQNLERIDFTGCTNLSEVHPSIGLLEKLVFLSLQNCKSLVSLNFDSESRLSSLKVLRLFGCTKLENPLDFTGALILEYIDMDQCKGLATIHESIGTLAKLRFLSLRECTNLVTIPDCLNGMTSLVTLDLRGCLNFTNMPVDSPPISLIYLDLSFCNISEVPDAIGELRFLERLNLQGNNFITIPSTIKGLSNLSYLNLSHCHRLRDLPDLKPEAGPSNSVGEYFKTTSGSPDHRSGLYFFDCSNMASFSIQSFVVYIQLTWIVRLVQVCTLSLSLSLSYVCEFVPMIYNLVQLTNSN
jgi:Leucine-rich repeat (LRR) protein